MSEYKHDYFDVPSQTPSPPPPLAINTNIPDIHEGVLYVVTTSAQPGATLTSILHMNSTWTANIKHGGYPAIVKGCKVSTTTEHGNLLMALAETSKDGTVTNGSTLFLVNMHDNHCTTHEHTIQSAEPPVNAIACVGGLEMQRPTTLFVIDRCGARLSMFQD